MKSNVTKSLWILFFIIQSTFMYAQSYSVTGTVIDENGETLIGVTIVEKGTSNGTATDMDGVYSIDVAARNAVLVFSYTGYSKKEVIANNPTLDVQMEEHITKLDEILVTGIRGAQLRSTAVKRNSKRSLLKILAVFLMITLPMLCKEYQAYK